MQKCSSAFLSNNCFFFLFPIIYGVFILVIIIIIFSRVIAAVVGNFFFLMHLEQGWTIFFLWLLCMARCILYIVSKMKKKHMARDYFIPRCYCTTIANIAIRAHTSQSLYCCFYLIRAYMSPHRCCATVNTNTSIQLTTTFTHTYTRTQTHTHIGDLMDFIKNFHANV